MQTITLTWGLAEPITVDAETRPNQRRLPRPAAPFCRPRPCCAALRPARRNRFQLAQPVTPFPRVMAVSRPAANIARAGRVTITGRITATAIPSAASPISAVAWAACRCVDKSPPEIAHLRLLFGDDLELG